MPTYNVIEQGDSFHIQPKDIQPTGHLFDAFDNMETEVSARYIVRLCQRKKGWYPFSRVEIETLYNEAGREGFSFNRLISPGMAFSILNGYVPAGGGWVVEKDGLYYVTDDFVERCHKSAPMEGD